MSITQPWGPPPVGLDVEKNQNGSIIASVVIIMVIGLASVVVRWMARLSKTGPGLGVDDFVVVAAAILGIGNATCCLVSIHWGGGRHLWNVSIDEFIKLYQTTFAFVIVYINSVTLTKLSILLYYRRIFGTSVIWWLVLSVTVAHGAEVSLTWLAACRPISHFWLQYVDPTSHGSCIDAPKFWFVNGIIGMLIDVSILLVPIPTVYKLHMPWSQKFFVCAILLLGSFVCVASVVRIIMMDRLVRATDFTWAMCQVFIWSCLEPFIGILCACLPTYAPFLRRWYTEARSHSASPLYPKASDPGQHDWSRIEAGKASTTSTGSSDPESDTELASAVHVRAVQTPRFHRSSKTGEAATLVNEILVTRGFSLHQSSSMRDVVGPHACRQEGGRGIGMEKEG